MISTEGRKEGNMLSDIYGLKNTQSKRLVATMQPGRAAMAGVCISFIYILTAIAALYQRNYYLRLTSD
ncbi:MAG: hypothetical protein SCH39_04840 [Methanosarcinales archaeon]|nr:hypothetical protein [ANME-2 cluster archaeon]MDW7775652.1 hypothetical protein [Methanosarcinales archaeon]